MTAAAPRLDLEQARARLRELGYLQGRVERFFLRRALEGRGGLVLPAVAAGAVCAALASVSAVEASDGMFRGHFSAALVLLAHLSAANLLPAALVGWIAARSAHRSRSPAVAATAFGLACAAMVFLLFAAGHYSLAGRPSAAALPWAALSFAAAFLLGVIARSAFLALAYARSGALPGARPRRAAGIAVALVLLALGALLLPSPPPAESPAAPLPSPRPVPLLVLAVDGLALDEESGTPEVAAIRSLLEQGAAGWWPAPHKSPPELWTDLATGVSADRHGVRALARVRPDGSPLGVRPPLGTRWYLQGLGPAAALVASEPVSATERRALAFWEVSASAGLSSAAVGWWASGQWPGALVVDNRELLLGAGDGLAVDARATALLESAGSRSVATVYLPGADILRGQPESRRLVLQRFLSLLSEKIPRAAAGELVLVVLAAESHPLPGALDRMVVFDGGAARTVRIRPEDVAPSLLARAGVPFAQDLPGRPAASLFAPGSLETVTVATYGPRVATQSRSAAATDREYLERLKSLGYLN
ncbi:MAG: hypothetical protein ABR576_12040 [Thermoanaerobaculia bacterium]